MCYLLLALEDVEYTVELQVIWDSMTLMYRQYNDMKHSNEQYWSGSGDYYNIQWALTDLICINFLICTYLYLANLRTQSLMATSSVLN